MATAYVIYADPDADFVAQHLLPALPILGYEHWTSSQQLSERSLNTSEVMDRCGAVLVIVSEASARLRNLRRDVTEAFNARRPILPIQIDDIPPAELLAELGAVAKVDVSPEALAADRRTATSGRVATLLQQLLPPPGDPPASGESQSFAQRIDWNDQLFSRFLLGAIAHHDYSRSSALVSRYAAELQHRARPYPTEAAQRDLQALRRKRQFPLMRRYAQAVLDAGIRDFQVRRQYAQSLIELADYNTAIEILQQIVREAPSRDEESYEARGLLGRAHKQLYVNAPGKVGATVFLRRAIHYYADAFEENADLVWHGVNAASCIVRSHRDGLQLGGEERAHRFAVQVLDTLAAREQTRHLEAWDLATRVEALVLLGDIAAAHRAMDAYLAHPGADAFEVSSTHRQFQQVLQLHLAEKGEARQLVERLWEAVQRHRAPVAFRTDDGADERSLHLVVRVSDPSWEPSAAYNCVVRGRLGTIISLDARHDSIGALLADPRVISVDESRRIHVTATSECANSLPFILATPPYECAAGAFDETGRNALIAVIDDGIDVLHRAFMDGNGQTRLVGVWDQNDVTGPPPPGFTFGTYHDAVAINGYIARGAVPPTLGRNVDGHGTHVASIAAGRRAEGPEPDLFVGGVAPDARLLVVIADASAVIGYSDAHIAALNFISNIADSLQVPVVVNVSQGMNAGAHDGRSKLEAAFDAFSEGGRKPGRVIVKSAGNGGELMGHAFIEVPNGGATPVRWQRFRSPQWEYEYIEFWWDSANSFEFTLVSPSNERSATVKNDHAKDEGQFGGCPYRMQLVQSHVDNGDSQLVVEIGSATSDAFVVEPGEWSMEIGHAAAAVDAPRELHAWIERGPSPASKFHPPQLSTSMTLTVPGTANTVITVAAVNATNKKFPVTSGFSSLGPTRDNRKKPDVAAPGEAVSAARGGTFDQAFIDTGTSMAAPHVAGAIALVLSRAIETGNDVPAASQIAAALRQKTLRPTAQWDRGLGFGIVNVTALLRAFNP